MDVVEIIDISCSDGSDCEIVSISTDDEISNRTTNSRIKNLREPARINSVSNQEETQNIQSTSSSTSFKLLAYNTTMTCVKEHTPIPPVNHKYDNKTWSKVKREKECMKGAPCESNRTEEICISSFDDTSQPSSLAKEDGYSSDELPDLEQREKSVDYEAICPSPGGSSPILLSSDDDPAGPRLGLFASLETSKEKNEHDAKNTSKKRTAATGKLNGKFLFTPADKIRMAQIFENVLKKNKQCVPHSLSASSFSDIFSCSSDRRFERESRHFMDVMLISAGSVRSSSPVHSLSDVSDSTFLELDDLESDAEFVVKRNKNYEQVGNNSDTKSATSNLKQGISNTLEPPSKKAKICIPDHSLPGNQVMQVDIRRFFHANPNKSYDKLCCKECFDNLISYKSQFPSASDEITGLMSQLHVNSVAAILEEGASFLDYALALIHDFSDHFVPTESIVKDIVEKGLFGKGNHIVMHKSFKLLSSIWQKYPSSINIDWNCLSREMGTFLGKTLIASSTHSAITCSLYLNLVVQGFEIDLKTRNLHSVSETQRSLACKYLSVDLAYTNMRQIICWISSMIKCEYNRVSDHLHSHCNYPVQNSDVSAYHLPKILSDLQKLLQLSILVSRNCMDASRRVACQLVQTYIFLSNIQCKKLFLQTMTCDLLKFKVTQKILEDYCDGTSPCCEDFPVSLKQVVQSYYRALPPRSPRTPSTSPLDDDNIQHSVLDHQYSASSCEELAMLVYINTQSYLQCVQTKGYKPLQHQLQRKKKDITVVNSSDLEYLRLSVDEFQGQMKRMTSELNDATHAYLIMMKCLTLTR